MRFGVDCETEEQTDHVGWCLARAACAGLVVALNGELGSGKTRLVRALCEGLGISSQDVSSPTFVIMQLYGGGRLPVAHLDTYRLGDVDEFLAIGADEYLHSGDWVCLIEWAERVVEVLPEDRLEIWMTQTGVTARHLEITSHGPLSEQVLSQLRLEDDIATH